MESLLVFLWAFRSQVLAGSIIFLVTQVAIQVIKGKNRPKYRVGK